MRVMIVVLLTAFLSACATTGPKVQKLVSTKTMNFTYMVPVDKYAAEKMVKEGLLKQNHFKTEIRWRNGYRQIRLGNSATGIDVQYIHAQFDSGKWNRTITHINIPVIIKTAPNKTTITVAEPNDAREETGHTLLVLPISPYAKMDETINNTRYMVDHLKLASYVKPESIELDLVSKYNNSSIRDNFKRLASNCEFFKDGSGECYVLDSQCDLTMYEYHNGTKIHAKLWIKKHFNPDGTSDTPAAEKQLAAAQKKLKSIVAD